MDPLRAKARFHTHDNEAPPGERPSGGNTERFIKATFERLPARTKVLVALFSALNSATTLTKGFELSDHLWTAMRFDTHGPLPGESEEANWLKGVCDGIRMMSDYS